MVGHSPAVRAIPIATWQIVRLDEVDVGRLWTGPFDGLVRAWSLDLAILLAPEGSLTV